MRDAGGLGLSIPAALGGAGWKWTELSSLIRPIARGGRAPSPTCFRTTTWASPCRWCWAPRSNRNASWARPSRTTSVGATASTPSIAARDSSPTATATA
ncbi:hypothetical protein KBY88_14915 [Cyanobium sp. Morenito 9A2]|nr:hypothetical protein [Cyanobium sp. Morenito 9A2]